MNFWQFLDKMFDRLPGWPSERMTVTLLLAALVAGLLNMAKIKPDLWDVELFKLILQATIITGALNMILAFHFAANKSDEQKANNTGKLADAFKAVAANSNNVDDPDSAADAADQVVEAAETEAGKIKARKPK